MIIFCPEVDDEHGSFPHRLVVIPENIVRRNRHWVVTPETIYVVCALCDHWVNGRIKCPCSCHAETANPCLAPVLSG